MRSSQDSRFGVSTASENMENSATTPEIPQSCFRGTSKARRFRMPSTCATGTNVAVQPGDLTHGDRDELDPFVR